MIWGGIAGPIPTPTPTASATPLPGYPRRCFQYEMHGIMKTSNGITMLMLRNLSLFHI
jgi:hypothetical protein